MSGVRVSSSILMTLTGAGDLQALPVVAPIVVGQHEVGDFRPVDQLHAQVGALRGVVDLDPEVGRRSLLRELVGRGAAGEAEFVLRREGRVRRRRNRDHGEENQRFADAVHAADARPAWLAGA